MNSMAFDVADMLEAESALGLNLGLDLFIDRHPSISTLICVVNNTSAASPSITLDKKTYFNSSVQIMVKGPDYNIAFNLINNIMGLLHGRAQETWNGTLYSVIQAVSEPMPLGTDDKQNHIFVCNFNAMRR